MIRFHFFGDSLKYDATEIWRILWKENLKPRISIHASETRKTVTYHFFWLCFGFSITRDIAKTKWKDLYKENENA